MAAIDYGVIAFKNGHLITGEWKLGAGAEFELPGFIEMHRMYTHDLTNGGRTTFDPYDGKFVHYYKISGVDIKTKEVYAGLMLTQFRYQGANYSIVHGYGVAMSVMYGRKRCAKFNHVLRNLSKEPLPFATRSYTPYWLRRGGK